MQGLKSLEVSSSDKVGDVKDQPHYQAGITIGDEETRAIPRFAFPPRDKHVIHQI